MLQKIIFYKDEDAGFEIVSVKGIKKNYPLHNHVSVHAFGLVLSGKINIIKAGKATEYSEKQVFYIKPYECHSLYSDDEYDMLTVCINTTCFDNYNQLMIKSSLVKALELITRQNKWMNTDISILINTIDEIHLKHDRNKIFIDTTFKKISEYIEKFPEQEIPIDKMATAINMSKYHMLRQFKKKIGLTPHKFQIQNKIRKSKLLISNKISLTEVALAAGFYDQSHFIKCFKSIVGMTPSEYIIANIGLCNKELTKCGEELCKNQ